MNPRKVKCLNLIILASHLAIYCLAQHAELDTLKKLADNAYEVQDYVSALELYKNCFDLDSTQIFCLEKAALSAYKLGSFKLSKDLFLSIEKKEPEHTTALTQLASIFEQEENAPKAIKYYLKLSKKFPENPVYHRKIGQQYYKSENLIEAFQYFAKAYKLNPVDVHTVEGLSQILLLNQQYELSDSILRASLIVDKSNIRLLLLFAQGKYKQRQFDSTALILEQTVQQIDLNNYYNKMLGFAYLQIDSLDQSIYYLEKALVGEGSPEYAHYYLATAYTKKDELVAAKHHYQEAIKASISDNIGLYYRNLARIFDDEMDLKSAIPNYQEAYKHSKDPVLLFYLARASDVYYKDKNIALRYYSGYFKSSHDNEDYKRYASQRSMRLREQIHFSN